MVDGSIWNDLLACTRQSLKYLRFHALVSTRLACALSNIVWLIFGQLFNLSLVTLGLFIKLGGYFYDLGLHLIYLGLFILLVSFFKSLQPRYRFLPNHNCANKKGPKNYHPLLHCILHETHPVSKSEERGEADDICSDNGGLTFKETLLRLLAALKRRREKKNKSCAHSVTDGNIQSIYKQLSLSITRSEFESVYWLNHTLQTLWPVGRTLTKKLINETLKQTKREKFPSGMAAGLVKRSSRKFSLIKAENSQRRTLKLSDFLSCRRQLEMLHKNKRLVMNQEDEYLGHKTIMMVVYLLKKFILCLKQYIIDQLIWLVAYMSSRGVSRSIDQNRSNRKAVELDLRGFLSRQNVRFKPNIRSTKSASGTAIHSKDQQEHAGGIRFRSAPGPGLACNSRRIINGGCLIGFDGLRSLRNKRLKLVRSINQMVIKTREAEDKANNTQRPITVETLDFGETAPKITAIKFLEKGEDLLAESLIRSSPTLMSSSSNTMRLIVELSFKSGSQFQISLSSVPVLGRLKLTKFRARIRLLVAINHMSFDADKNLEIRQAIDSDQLLPIFNQIQIALVDSPQLDWHVKRAESVSGVASPGRSIKRRLKRSSKNTDMFFANLVKTPREVIRRNLQPIHLINNSYFKYLLHAAAFFLQGWFQSFDILLSEKLYLKTLC